MTDEDFLSRFKLDESHQLIGGLDSGALLLGALGLLKGKCATTYPTAEIERLWKILARRSSGNRSCAKAAWQRRRNVFRESYWRVG